MMRKIHQRIPCNGCGVEGNVAVVMVDELPGLGGTTAAVRAPNGWSCIAARLGPNETVNLGDSDEEAVVPPTGGLMMLIVCPRCVELGRFWHTPSEGN